MVVSDYLLTMTMIIYIT